MFSFRWWHVPLFLIACACVGKAAAEEQVFVKKPAVCSQEWLVEIARGDYTAYLLAKKACGL